MYRSYPQPNLHAPRSEFYKSTLSTRFLDSRSALFDNGSVDDFCRRIQSETLVRKTHLLCEGGVGFPGGGVAGVGLFHHLVDLLE